MKSVKDKIIDKKEIYLTYFITLINVSYLVQKLLTVYLHLEEGEVISTTLYFDIYIFTMAAIVLGLVVVCCCVYNVEKKSYDELENRNNFREAAINDIKRYNALKNSNIVDYKLYDFDFITKKEQSVKKGSEIWIITGDLEEDVNNQDLGEIINANLKKGVVYRYFISKVNNQVSGKARSGIESLKESYDSFWDSRLFVTEINSQLIAPDIDIIIYNATDVATKREGYTCVEIGNNSDTYVYQRLDGQIVGEIYTKLDPTNNHKKRRKKSLGLSKKIKSKRQIRTCSEIFGVLL